MTARRLIALLSAVTALVAVPACSSSGGKQAAHSSSAPAPADVASTLSKGVAGIKAAQMSVNASLSGQKIAGSGPAEFSSGKITGLDLTGDVPALGHVRILLTDGTFYAKLPATFNTSGKPWVRVSGASGNPVLSQLLDVLTKIRSAVALDNLVTLVSNAKSVTDKGSDTIGGTPSTHYVVVPDPAKLPASFPGRSDLLGTLAGKPLDMWLDSAGRPVQVTQNFVLLGSVVAVTIGAREFDKPVTIKAPPAGDVAGG